VSSNVKVTTETPTPSEAALAASPWALESYS